MRDAIKKRKELLQEAARAFKTGLHGEEYASGTPLPPAIQVEDELKKLDDLRASGTLTEDEYRNARHRLLREPGATM